MTARTRTEQSKCHESRVRHRFRRMICEYEAPDAASVTSVQREAEAKFDRVWPADVLGEQ